MSTNNNSNGEKNITTAGSSDPKALLDTLDSFGSSRREHEAVGKEGESGGFDPIDFLNHHFVTEAALVNSLPLLRETIRERVEIVDNSISNAIQKQAELADLTKQDVAVAKSAIGQLTKRIQLVQSKAVLSEQAVLIITRDMKRLDYAKKHLSKTITAIKRLHMLLNAVHQLHIAATSQPFPDFKNAANLIDATRLLLSHFDTYMPSISKIRDIRDNLKALNQHLDQTILLGFRIVGIGFSKAIQNYPQLSNNNNNNNNNNSHQNPPPPMPTQVLADACLVVHALGQTSCHEFISTFCADHLEPYTQLFDPNNASSSSQIPASSSKPSFKMKHPSDLSSSIHGSTQTNINAVSASAPNNSNTAASNPNPASLDQVERRYSWYRRTLRDLDDKFNSVFPINWNLHYAITRAFLLKTGSHLLLLFQPVEEAPTLRDRDCQNVTVLLKALQKTILFEKEMTAWLQRDYKTIFSEQSSRKQTKSQHDDDDDNNEDDDEDELLEFDDTGKAVVATSAEGIRIKYERKMKERKKKQLSTEQQDAFSIRQQQADESHPVPTLIGLASKIFDKHMGPYIAQEEQYMDEQLQETVADATVDTRGDLPVFTSSTNLFVYIKNSITRCTSLTRGQTFFLLYQAFKKMLQKYAQLLSQKFPSQSSNAINIAGVGPVSVSLPGTPAGASIIYRIPAGEETTICHVIDTCEYCTDTVEALQDLIKDKIDKEYKSKIDMYDEQECFHDVTAKGLTVLVSGLAQRMELAIKEMSAINWGSLNVVGEESKYVRTMHDTIQPFLVSVRSVLPNTYFRNFCDKFAAAFTTTFYNAITRQKRISESGTQQFLLDVYNLKTLLLKLPVMEQKATNSTIPSPKSAGSTIAPAMYTKMVTKQFQRIEILLKLVGTPPELLIDVFKVQWENGTALDLQTVMNLKGMKRNEQAAMLERFGVDPATAMKGASMATSGSGLTENIQALQDKSSDVAAKVNSDLFQMRQKVEDFRRAFR